MSVLPSQQQAEARHKMPVPDEEPGFAPKHLSEAGFFLGIVCRNVSV
jgi:hypothetical protein